MDAAVGHSVNHDAIVRLGKVGAHLFPNEPADHHGGRFGTFQPVDLEFHHPSWRVATVEAVAVENATTGNAKYAVLGGIPQESI